MEAVGRASIFMRHFHNKVGIRTDMDRQSLRLLYAARHMFYVRLQQSCSGHRQRNRCNSYRLDGQKEEI